MEQRICEVCGKEFKVYPYRAETAKYCSMKCLHNRERTVEERKNISEGQRKRDNSTVNIQGLDLGREIVKNIPHTWSMGENNHMWRGGITKGKHKLLGSREYKEWRKKIFIRDNYTCQSCGQRGGRLHAHHIKPWTNLV